MIIDGIHQQRAAELKTCIELSLFFLPNCDLVLDKHQWSGLAGWNCSLHIPVRRCFYWKSGIFIPCMLILEAKIYQLSYVWTFSAPQTTKTASSVIWFILKPQTDSQFLIHSQITDRFTDASASNGAQKSQRWWLKEGRNWFDVGCCIKDFLSRTTLCCVQSMCKRKKLTGNSWRKEYLLQVQQTYQQLPVSWLRLGSAWILDITGVRESSKLIIAMFVVCESVGRV